MRKIHKETNVGFVLKRKNTTKNWNTVRNKEKITKNWNGNQLNKK